MLLLTNIIDMDAIATSVSLPAALAKALDRLAKQEHRTRSGMIQEAIRYYLEQKRWSQLQREAGVRAERLGIRNDEDIERLIDELRT